jgi:hypothetical protein
VRAQECEGGVSEEQFKKSGKTNLTQSLAQYQMGMTAEAVDLSPQIAEARGGDLLSNLSYLGLRVTIDPTLPPNQMRIIAVVDGGVRATLVYNIADE